MAAPNALAQAVLATAGHQSAGAASKPAFHMLKAASLLQSKLKKVRVKQKMNNRKSAERIAQERIEREEKKRYEKRLEILMGVKTFKDFTPEQLQKAALHMTELKLKEGHDVIKQGDSGHEFFIIEKGTAIVSRKMRPDDPGEVAQELVRLGDFAYFGEIALVTNEKRSATITAGPGGLELLVMTKDEFDKYLQTHSTVHQSSRLTRGREVVASIPIFQMLSEDERDEMLATMTSMQYKSGTYICAQGTAGNNFHIIVEGKCRVTIADDDHAGAERQVSTLNRDDFFGEVALLDKNNKRTANVITMTDVTTMTLSRSNFHKFLKKVRPMLMEHQALRGLQQSMLSPKRDKRKSETMFKHFARLIVTNLRRSVYYRFAGAIIRHPTGIQKFGHVVAQVFLANSDMATTREKISTAFKDAIQKDKISRSDSDVALIAGITKQNSRLKNEYMTSWPNYWYADLCRYMTYREVPSMTEIFENNSRGSTAYSVLRGTVSLMQYHADDNGHMIRKHYKDCGPGDCFGEHALVGMNNRGYTALALSDVELIEIEEKDFAAVTRNGRSAKTNNEKFEFMRKNVALFRDWEYYRLFRLASLCQYESLPKDTVVIQKGLCADHLYIIMSGSVHIQLPERTEAAKVDVAHNSEPSTGDAGNTHGMADSSGEGGGGGIDDHGLEVLSEAVHEKNLEKRVGRLRTISNLHTSDYFGETGLLTYGSHGKRVFQEHAYVVTSSYCEFLIINTSEFKMIDRATLDKVKGNFRLRVSWRGNRLRESRVHESRIGDNLGQIRKWPKSYENEKADQNPLMARVERFKEKQKTKAEAASKKTLRRPKSAGALRSSSSTPLLGSRPVPVISVEVPGSPQQQQKQQQRRQRSQEKSRQRQQKVNARKPQLCFCCFCSPNTWFTAHDLNANRIRPLRIKCSETRYAISPTCLSPATGSDRALLQQPRA